MRSIAPCQRGVGLEGGSILAGQQGSGEARLREAGGRWGREGGGRCLLSALDDGLCIGGALVLDGHSIVGEIDLGTGKAGKKVKSGEGVAKQEGGALS